MLSAAFAHPEGSTSQREMRRSPLQKRIENFPFVFDKCAALPFESALSSFDCVLLSSFKIVSIVWKRTDEIVPKLGRRNPRRGLCKRCRNLLGKT